MNGNTTAPWSTVAVADVQCRKRATKSIFQNSVCKLYKNIPAVVDATQLWLQDWEFLPNTSKAYTL
jgi:hypothetical protein